MIDLDLVFSVVLSIAVIGLLIAGIRAVLPNREPCTSATCHNVAPVALAWSGDQEAISITYATCGSESVQNVAVSNAGEGDILWMIQTDRPTTRDVFVLGEAVQPYSEIVDLADPLSGRYTVTVQADRLHTAVFHTREVPEEGVLFNGIPMSDEEWRAEARRLGDCVFWKVSSGTERAFLLTFGILIVAGTASAVAARRAIANRASATR